MNSRNLLIGALAGVAAGALIGVLFAPDKGTEIRGRIAKKSDDYLDEVKKVFNSFIDGVSGKFEGVKEEVSDFATKKSRETKRDMQASA